MRPTATGWPTCTSCAAGSGGTSTARYCYLLIDPCKNVTPNAARRLRAIEEFSDLGAGFALAMRDLEIRGAGNLLGTQQSGHIAAVGYELYCQLLENAVRRLKQMPPKMSIDVDLALPGQAYLPPEYVPDMRLKIDLYRKLSRITSRQELEEYRGRAGRSLWAAAGAGRADAGTRSVEDRSRDLANCGDLLGRPFPGFPIHASSPDRAVGQAQRRETAGGR